MGWRFNFNTFNFPQHFGVLKYRLQAGECEKSVLEFQHEYGDFKLQYLEFFEKYLCFFFSSGLSNMEKAGFPCGEARFAVAKIRHFGGKSKKC